MPRDCPHLSKEQLIALLQAREDPRLDLEAPFAAALEEFHRRAGDPQ